MKKSFVLMWVFWLVLLAFGLLDPYVSNHLDSGAYFLTTSVVTTACLFSWFLFDARETNYSTSSGLKIAVIAIGVIAIPYYILRAKGFKRAMISFLKFIGFVLAYIACFVVVEYINV